MSLEPFWLKRRFKMYVFIPRRSFDARRVAQRLRVRRLIFYAWYHLLWRAKQGRRYNALVIVLRWRSMPSPKSRFRKTVRGWFLMLRCFGEWGTQWQMFRWLRSMPAHRVGPKDYERWAKDWVNLHEIECYRRKYQIHRRR